MKANKILMIIQTIGMYISQISILAIFIVIDTHINTEKVNAIADYLGDTYFICLVIILLISMINIVVALFSLKRPATDISSFVLSIKLIQIPWYITNFILTVLVLVGMMNPFLIFASPIFLILSVFITYLFMLSTSLPLVISTAKSMKMKPSISTVPYILALISLFFFVLDVVGSICIYVSKIENEKQKKRDLLTRELEEYERTN